MSCDRQASLHRRSRGAALRYTAFASAALASLGLPANARAQNTEPFYYSEDAAKVAGAVVARPGDSAALHYNPAGLASITRGRVSANGSVFGLRVRNFDDAFQTTFGGIDEQLDLRATDVVSAPNALSASFHLGSVTLSAGLFVTERDVRQASDDLVDAPVPDYPGGLYTKRVEIQRDLTKYHLGTGLGFELAKGVRLGAAVFATYRTAASIAQYAPLARSPCLSRSRSERWSSPRTGSSSRPRQTSTPGSTTPSSRSTESSPSMVE